ncbi:MAG: deoxyribonuclease V [Flammeovirgaceae bacterium]|jgi:deoxyribonuclease V
MILIVDVGYQETTANIGAVVIDGFEEENLIWQENIRLENIVDYESGKFYKRELPCLLHTLSVVPESISLVIIDGNVWLDGDGKKGLGAYLFEELKEEILVIGVAKAKFKTLNSNFLAVKRGESEKLLFVTTAGIELEEASGLIRNMQGDFRIPEKLKLADSLSRDWS